MEFALLGDIAQKSRTITRDQFSANRGIWAEPQNLSISAEFLHLRGIWYRPVIRNYICRLQLQAPWRRQTTSATERMIKTESCSCFQCSTAANIRHLQIVTMHRTSQRQSTSGRSRPMDVAANHEAVESRLPKPEALTRSYVALPVSSVDLRWSSEIWVDLSLLWQNLSNDSLTAYCSVSFYHSSSDWFMFQIRTMSNGTSNSTFLLD